MKSFLIAAISADGFIAPAGGTTTSSTSWTSAEDKKFFVQKTKEAGVMIMGSRTYETIGKPLPGRHTIVYSDDKIYEGVETTRQNPRLLLEDLKRRGYTEVAICGGSTIYTMFMEAGLLDVLYLTVEPVVFGQGVPLFSRSVSAHLSLRAMTPLNKHTILLEYGVGN
ncbi:MAG: dihydrofolate reductase [Candidatus Wildermuthbacteria bacterium]|nr:dihydrofolate reductase [Candidatus Wildermuthbacteria bacterium]